MDGRGQLIALPMPWDGQTPQARSKTPIKPGCVDRPARPSVSAMLALPEGFVENLAALLVRAENANISVIQPAFEPACKQPFVHVLVLARAPAAMFPAVVVPFSSD